MKRSIFYIVFFLFCSCRSSQKSDSAEYKKSNSLNHLAKICLQNNNLDSAKYYIDQALIWDSTNYAAYNNRAIVNFKQNGGSDEVVADFETALRLKPSYETALYSLANYYDEVKDYKKVIIACNHYSFRKSEIDSEHIKEINRLNLRALQYERQIGNISVVKAIAFYDSINLILRDADSVQLRFNNKLLEISKSILADRHRYCDFPYFRRQFDSLMVLRKKEFNAIGKFAEIDDNLNFRDNALNYLTVITTTYEAVFNRLLYCIETKDVILIRNCLASMKPFSIKLQKAQADLQQLRKAFEGRYKI